MKRTGTAIAIMLSACMLQACQNKAANFSNADSAGAAQDTSTTLNLAVDDYDTEFAVKAAGSNLTEIALGQLAIKNGRSKKVKNFGVMMIKDRGKANDQLIAIAKSKKIILPSTLDSASQKVLALLSKKTGDAFDKAYIGYMINDHQEDVKMFTDESTKIQDPDLQAFAIKTLPVLQKHLDAINAIHDSMTQ